jgi:hypothetical protein
MAVERDLSELGQAYSELVGSPVAVRVILVGGSWSVSLTSTGWVYDDGGISITDRTLSKAIEVAQKTVLVLARKKRIKEAKDEG